MCKKTKMRNSLPSNNSFINWALLEKIGVYYILNPNSSKILNINSFQFIFIFIILIQQCIIIYGLLGYYITMTEETNDNLTNMFSLFCYILNCMCMVRATIFMYKSNEICELINVTSNNFLTSRHCQKYFDICIKYGKLSKQLTYSYCILMITGALFWASLPLVLYVLSFKNVNSDNTTNRRFDNIFNYRFPMNMDTYNKYFILFFINELANDIFIASTQTAFFVFIITFGLVFIAQYEIIAQAFANIGYNDQITQNDNEAYSVQNFWNDYAQVVADQQKLYLKLKSYYSIIWFGIQSSIAVLSFQIIILAYTFVMTIETASISMIIKIMFPCSLFFIELFFYCYILEIINTKKESGSHGIYSSNWTRMNLKTKKNVLLLIRMNNVNKLMMKISPNKIINLQLFASVMKISYNIVSVMLKSRNK